MVPTQMINGVDFGQVAQDALGAARAALGDEGAWQSLNGIVADISDGLAADIALIAEKKASGEFNEDDARAYLGDKTMVARIRIRSVAIIGLQMAEQVWNAVAGVFHKAIGQALGWALL